MKAQIADCERRWGRRVVVFCAASTVMSQIAGRERRWGRRVVLLLCQISRDNREPILNLDGVIQSWFCAASTEIRL